MVTVNKYLYEDDFGQKICLCSEKQEYKVLFREVNETELKTNDVDSVTKASIYKMEKLVVMCTECKKIYFISLSFDILSSFAYSSGDSATRYARNLYRWRKTFL